MKIGLSVRFKTSIVNAETGAVEGGNDWKNNLVLDNALNSLARKAGITACPATFPAGCFTNIILGSGTNPTSIASGAITFTQATNTVTASAGFFTAAMVGGILKYGTGSGGVETYITGFTSSTIVTVDTSATVTTTVGTVWMVQQTALQTPLTLASSSYQTNSGDNSTTYVGNVVTYQRSFIVAQQASPYTVNEIGWNSSTLGTTTNGVAGRIVLGSSDVVGTSNFYLVVMQIQFTYSPGSPTAVSNVGTNINTAGNAMIEAWCIQQVAASGLVSNSIIGSARNTMDGSGTTATLVFATATYSQNSSMSQANGVAWTEIAVGTNNHSWTYLAASVGIMQLSFSGSLTTTGQTLFGIGIQDLDKGTVIFDVKFTATQTAPTGTFQPNTVFQIVYGRTLTN